MSSEILLRHWLIIAGTDSSALPELEMSTPHGTNYTD